MISSLTQYSSAITSFLVEALMIRFEPVVKESDQFECREESIVVVLCGSFEQQGFSSKDHNKRYFMRIISCKPKISDGDLGQRN